MTTKVTISLPDELADFADRLASQSGKPRSQIIAELLEARRAQELYEELARGYEEMAEENLRFAKAAFPLAAEIWDDYDWDFENEAGAEKPSKRRPAKK